MYIVKSQKMAYPLSLNSLMTAKVFDFLGRLKAPVPGVVGDMILLPGTFPIEAYAERVERSLIARGIVPCAFTGVIPGAYFGVGSE